MTDHFGNSYEAEDTNAYFNRMYWQLGPGEGRRICAPQFLTKLSHSFIGITITAAKDRDSGIYFFLNKNILGHVGWILCKLRRYTWGKCVCIPLYGEVISRTSLTEMLLQCVPIFCSNADKTIDKWIARKKNSCHPYVYGVVCIKTGVLLHNIYCY